MHTTVLNDLWLVESMDVDPQIRRADCKVIFGFSTAQGSEPLTTPCVVQGSTIPPKGPTSKYHHTGEKVIAYEF